MICSAVVLVHPSRLFAEALASLLDNVPFKLRCVACDIDDVPFEDLRESKTAIFLLGGQTSECMSKTIRSIRQRLASAVILVIGNTNVPQEVVTALEAGANGYLREAMTSQTLIMALELVLREEIILPLEMAKCLPNCITAPAEAEATPSNGQQLGLPSAIKVSSFQPGGEPQCLPQCIIAPPEAHLSPKEAIILRALADGAPNKVIAQSLAITEATVKVHVKAVLRKIRVRNRTQAAVWAVKNLPSPSIGR